MTEAGKDLDTAYEGKAIPAHSVVDEAISALKVICMALSTCSGVEGMLSVKSGSAIRLFELPLDALYRPPAYKTEHMDARNYLGKATVQS